MKKYLHTLYTLYIIAVIVEGGIGMTSFSPDFAGVCIVSLLILTLFSIFLVTIWSVGHGRCKQAGNRNNDLHFNA